MSRIKRLSRSPSKGWRGRVYDWKTDRSLAGHSHLELELFALSQVEPYWKTPVEHPLRVAYFMGGRRLTLVPSLYVFVSGEPWLFACRWETAASSPGSEAKWTAVGETLAALGYGFEVITERHLRQQPRARNVTEIHRGRFAEPPTAHVVAQVRRAVSKDRLRLADLVAQVEALTPEQALLLLLRGVIIIDLNEPLETAMLELGPRSDCGDRP